MTFEPISAAESTARGDITANARSFAHRLRAGNEAPNTIKAYLDAVGQVDAFFEARACPRALLRCARSTSRRSSKTNSAD